MHSKFGVITTIISNIRGMQISGPDFRKFKDREEMINHYRKNGLPEHEYIAYETVSINLIPELTFGGSSDQ